MAALRANDAATAEKICDQLLRLKPGDIKARALRAAVRERAGKLDPALADYRKALAIDPKYLPALEGAAQLEYKARSSEAEPLLRRIVALQPANAVAHAMLGMIDYRAKNYESAATEFSAAGPALNAQPDALMAEAICLSRLDRLEQAASLFTQLLALRPESEAVRFDLAMILWRGGKPDAALNTLQPLLDAHAASSHSLRLAADIHESANETPAAVELLRAAILANPKDAANYVDFATLAFMHGSFDVGIDMINRGLTQLPRSADLYMARGVLYGQNSQYEKAMADFDQAHAIDPAYSMTTSAEGIAFSQQHDHGAALERFRHQVAEHPRDALGHYLLAEALSWAPPESGGSASEDSVHAAIAEAQKAIELDPHLVEAEDLLATLDLESGRTGDAIAAARAAMALDAGDQQALYTLILAMRKTGDKDELKGLVERLTELRKNDAADNTRRKRYGRLVELDEK